MGQFSFDHGGLSLSVTFHPARCREKAVLLYYHGGGLLFGSRDDLPRPYVHRLTEAGYHLLCMDYLLAPECTLAQIHRSVDAGFAWFLRHRREDLGIGACPVFLFGRSAGAYLALNLANRLIRDGAHPPQGILAFYGYHHFDHPFFRRPSPHYCAFPALSPRDLPCCGGSPRCCAPPESHFLLYVYARQQGAWVGMLRPDAGTPADWSVSDGELSRFPPTFLTASTADQDVPFSYSRALSQLIPDQEFVVCHGVEHDFDRDPDLAQSREVYDRCVQWLDRHLT